VKISDLEAILAKAKVESGDIEVMILDGSNGGGVPREINIDSYKVITEEHADDCADCENKVGEKVFTLGYGCY